MKSHLNQLTNLSKERLALTVPCDMIKLALTVVARAFAAFEAEMRELNKKMKEVDDDKLEKLQDLEEKLQDNPEEEEKSKAEIDRITKEILQLMTPEQKAKVRLFVLPVMW